MTSKIEQRRNLSISLPADMAQALDSEAERRGISRSALIQRAVQGLKLKSAKPASDRTSWPFRKMEVGETTAVRATVGKLHLQALRDAKRRGMEFTEPKREGDLWVVTRTA